VADGPCIGCGRSCAPVDFVAIGSGAVFLSVPDETIVATIRVCARCTADGDRELAQLRAQRRRLELRGISPKVAARMMARRVDRYFRNGTLLPISKRAVD